MLPSPIQTILSALDLHQILHTQRWLAGLEFTHHRRLGISPDPEGNYYIMKLKKPYTQGTGIEYIAK